MNLSKMCQGLLTTCIFIAVSDFLSFAMCKDFPTCRKGQHVYHHSEGYGCKVCPEGSYMPYKTHSYLMCKTCQKAVPYLYEVEAGPCTATANTIIKCKPNYYREEMKDSIEHLGSCRRCSVCRHIHNAPFKVKKCSDFQNTLCCPRPTDVAMEAEDGMFVCSGDETLTKDPQASLTYTPQRLPPKPKGEVNYFTGCNPGEYMTFSNPDNQLANCLRCPHGTFMDKKKHMETHCQECSAEEGKILLRKCTPTSDAVFGDVGDDRKTNTGARVCVNSMVFVCIAAAATTIYLFLL